MDPRGAAAQHRPERGGQDAWPPAASSWPSYPPPSTPGLRLGYKKLFSCVLTSCFAVYRNMSFCLELRSNFSKSAKTIFPDALVSLCKSLSQMYKHRMTSGERNVSFAT